MMATKRKFGGKQDGAGRPALPEEEKKGRRVVYLSPSLDGKLVDSVGDGRGAVSQEIVRILELYFDTPKII